MEDQAELIRQQMQEKRAELSEKLQELAEKLPVAETVTEAVESASETVTDTAENVKETVHSFEELLDLPKQVQEHPWLAVGGAVVVGYLAHDILAARKGGGESILSEPLRELEGVAMRAAMDVVAHTVTQAVQGGLLGGTYGPILENLLGQFAGALKGKSTGGQSPNGRGTEHCPTPSAPSRQPAGTTY